MVGVMRHLGRRRTGGFDARLVRDVDQAERGKTQARQRLRRMTQNLQAEVRSFQGQSVEEFAAFAADLEADYIEATRLYQEFMNVNPNDPVLTDLDRHIREIRRHLRTVLKDSQRQIKQQVGVAREFNQFVREAERATTQRRGRSRRPRTGGGTGGGAPQLKNFNHVPTGGTTTQRMATRSVANQILRSAGRGALNAGNFAAHTMMTGSFGQFPGIGRSRNAGGSATANADGPRVNLTRMTDFERTTLGMNREIMRRDREFQEWQQDFWEKFGRRFERGQNQKKDSGWSIGDLLAGALGLGALKRWMGKGLGAIGDLIKGFGRGLRGLVGKALGLGAILNMDEIGKFLSDFNSRFSTRWNGFVDGINGRLESMRTNLGDRFGSIRTQFENSIRGLSDAITARVTGLRDSALTVFDDLSRTVGEGVGRARDAFTTTLDEFGNVIGTRIDAIRTDFRARLDGFGNMVDEFGNMMATKATAITEGINSAFTTATDAVRLKFEEMRTNLTTNLENVRVSVTDSVHALTSSVGSAFEATLTTVSDFTSRATVVFDEWTAKVGGAMDATGAKISELADRLGKSFDDAGSMISNSATRVVDEMGRASTAVSEFAGRAGTDIGNFVDNSVNKLSTLPERMNTLLQPTLDTLESWANRLGTIIGEIPATIENAFSAASDMASRAVSQVGELASSAGSAVKSGASTIWEGGRAAGHSVLKAGEAVINSPAAKAVASGAAAVGSAIVDNPVTRAAGKVIGTTARVAGPVGDVAGGVLGAVNVQENHGLLHQPTVSDRVGGAVSGVIDSGIPDVAGLITGNEFRPGSGERAMRGLGENLLQPEAAAEAEALASKLLRGENVPTTELGTDEAFLSMVIRRVNDIADHHRKNLTRDNLVSGNAQLHPELTPKELDFLWQNPNGVQFLLNDPEGFAAFVKANNYAAGEAEAAVRRYFETVKTGAPKTGTLRRMHGDMRALAAEVQKELAEYKPVVDPETDAILKRAEELSGKQPAPPAPDEATVPTPVPAAEEKSGWRSWLPFNVGGVISQPIIAQPLSPRSAPLGRDGGETITIAETTPEAVFPLVRDPSTGNLGVETHTIAPKGPVNLKTEEFGIHFENDSARAFATALIEAIKKYIDPDAIHGGEEGEGKGTADSMGPNVATKEDAPTGTGGGATVEDPKALKNANPNFIDHQAREKEDTVLTNEITAADAEVTRLQTMVDTGQGVPSFMEDKVAGQLAAAKKKRADLDVKKKSIETRRRAEDDVAEGIKERRATTTSIADLGELPGVDNPAARAARIAGLERDLANAPNEEVKAIVQRDLDAARSANSATATAAVPAPVQTGETLGKVSATYEGKVNSANKDNIGHAYGKYQFNSSTGGLNQFFKDNPDYAAKFNGIERDSPEFYAKWKEVAAADPQGFERAQDTSARKLWYQPAEDHGKGLGFKFDDRGVQESVFSGSIQHGGIKKIMTAAAQTPGFADMSPADQVKAFYAARRNYVGGLSSLSDREKSGLYDRYSKEEANVQENFVGKDAIAADGTTTAAAAPAGINAAEATVGDMQKIETDLSAMVDNPAVGMPRERIEQMRTQRDEIRKRISAVQGAEKAAVAAGGGTAAPGAAPGTGAAAVAGVAPEMDPRQFKNPSELVTADHPVWNMLEPGLQKYKTEILGGEGKGATGNISMGTLQHADMLFRKGAKDGTPMKVASGGGSNSHSKNHGAAQGEDGGIGESLDVKPQAGWKPGQAEEYAKLAAASGANRLGVPKDWHGLHVQQATPKEKGGTGRPTMSWNYGGSTDLQFREDLIAGKFKTPERLAEIEALYPKAEAAAETPPGVATSTVAETPTPPAAATATPEETKPVLATTPEPAKASAASAGTFWEKLMRGERPTAEDAGLVQNPDGSHTVRAGSAAAMESEFMAKTGAGGAWAEGRQRRGDEGSRFGNTADAQGNFSAADEIQGFRGNDGGFGGVGGFDPFNMGGRGGGRGGSLLSQIFRGVKPGANGGIDVGFGFGPLNGKVNIGGKFGETLRTLGEQGAIVQGIVNGEIPPEAAIDVMKNLVDKGMLPPEVGKAIGQAEGVVNQFKGGLNNVVGRAEEERLKQFPPAPKAPLDSVDWDKTEADTPEASMKKAMELADEAEGVTPTAKVAPIAKSEPERAEAVAEPEPQANTPVFAPGGTTAVATPAEDTEGATRSNYQPTPVSAPVPEPRPEPKQQLAQTTTGKPGSATTIPNIDSIRNRNYDPEQVALLSNGLRTV